MARNRNTDISGKQFAYTTIGAVWNKGIVVPGVDPNKRRKDSCGAWMDRDQYGITNEHGIRWEIDHIKPVARGGSDDIANLQPLQWENNRAKSDNLPNQWSCAAVAKQ